MIEELIQLIPSELPALQESSQISVSLLLSLASYCSAATTSPGITHSLLLLDLILCLPILHSELLLKTLKVIQKCLILLELKINVN